MSLETKIKEDIKGAMKSGDSRRLEVLRFLIAQVNSKAIEKRAGGGDATLTDDDVTQVLQKEAKKRKEAVELYTQGGRADLAKSEEEELAIIYTYIPAPMERKDIEKVVADLKAAGNSEFNTLMKAAMAELKGKADGKVVGEVVKAALG